MKKVKGIYFLLASVLLSSAFTTKAAEITVDTGSNTLRTAIAAAEAGDVLILQDGIYTLSNPDLVIDKSVTIRAINKAATPRVYFLTGSNTPAISIQGADTDFILQGIYYYEGASVSNQPRIEIEGAVSSVALLENQFVSIDLAVNETTDADGNRFVVNDLVIVGNNFGGTNGSLYNIGSKNNFLFAGNSVSYNYFYANTYGAEANIIGNSFVNNYQLMTLYKNGYVGSYYRVIGNTFKQTLSRVLNLSVSNSDYAMLSLDGSGTFSNNIVVQGDNPYSATGTPGSFQFLTLSSSNSHWDISNNTFDVKPTALYDDSPYYEEAFKFASPVSFENNIIVGNLQPTMFTLTNSVTLVDSTFSNNLCFDNVASCDLDANKIEADPKFIDDIDYVLDVGSPAIDAGIDSESTRDNDGSVLDLGVHGGVFSYFQFEKQRTENTVEPYFYPLFEANTSLSTTGALKVKAVAIARLR
ncbi:hypothetical protein [Shewanella sp. 6_MG-2023]|uniref:hypothetical protein n=1 Tax=Shewanella sp. 6_MG-2023 TaxID=3062660 RepID=UPI0026E1D4D6|nr:hypothetical protein [Shewanella sp. 6_MG-2023]MDO6617635.1 hypothetical protein [Shewanella sp. 6_MG-2023]